MCGIAGFIDFNQKLGQADIVSMSDTLEHRGPDSSGYVLENRPNATIGLGHRRLSIIDLSASGHQPKTKAHLTIVYNGEVYNYQEIKKELESLGHQFESNSDTEVILSAFIEWDTEAVHKFNGMFAFVIYDSQRDRILVYRDRTGVKPVYYYFKNNLFLFASELKAFHSIPAFEKELDMEALGLFFQYGYVPTPHCIFKHCKKLEGGHFLHLDIKSMYLEKRKYWSVYDFIKPQEKILDEVSILEDLEGLMKRAFEYRMVADVPVGVFLSGGYDSSLVTAMLQKSRTQKLKTFTIGFEREKYNEAPHAAKVAEYLGTDHTEYICTEIETKEIIEKLPFIYDEPFGDSSAIPTYLVSKITSQSVKVALSADGGDELFVGYNRYRNAIKVAQNLKTKPKRLLQLAGKASEYAWNVGHSLIKDPLTAQKIYKLSKILQQPSPYKVSYYQTLAMVQPELKKLFRNQSFAAKHNGKTTNGNLNTILAYEYERYLQDDIMVKVDRAGMACSLEGREPLLDYQLTEYVMGLPFNVKCPNGQLKYLLKKITHKYLPEDLMNRPKQGFGIPILSWLQNDMRFLIDQFLDLDFIDRQGIFNPDFIKHKKQLFQASKHPGQHNFIWLMLIFQLWYTQWNK